MTKKEIMQINYLTNEIRMWQEELRNLEQNSEIHSMQFDKPMAISKGKFNSNTENVAISRAEISEIINGLLYDIQEQRKVIMNHIREIDDSLLRQIVFFRCISCMSWCQVASKIGAGTSADSVRMIFNRSYK